MKLGLSDDYLIGELICHELGSSESWVGRYIRRLQVILPIYRTSINQERRARASRSESRGHPEVCIWKFVYGAGLCSRVGGLRPQKRIG